MFSTILRQYSATEAQLANSCDSITYFSHMEKDADAIHLSIPCARFYEANELNGCSRISLRIYVTESVAG